MVTIDRRGFLTGGAMAGVTLAAAGTAQAQHGGRGSPPKEPEKHNGFVLAPADEANPLGVKIVAFTTVSPDVDASITFYRDLIGMTLADEGTLPEGVSTAPGTGRRGRRYALMAMEESSSSAAVRILEAPREARANRPRPDSGPWDPGLLVMEGLTRDPAESYHRLASAGTPVISPPRYYFFRNTTWGRDVDVMSYAPFGPGGEQMFITANIRNDRPEWAYPGLHAGFLSTSITSLDQRPVDAFYRAALGLKRTAQLECYQPNANELIGAPPDSYFLWGSTGTGVAMEVWEFWAESGTVYPTALDRTGLAMVTMRVNDIVGCRERCRDAGIEPVGEGALPLPGRTTTEGFTLRGAVGELIEVVPA